MGWNKNSGYGQGLVSFVRTIVPTFGNILVVMNSSDTDEANYQHVQEVFTGDSDGLLRFYTSLSDAIDAAESNNNDVILIDANSTHTLATAEAITKNRIHFIGMDGGGRMLQQGAKISNTNGTAAAYVIKNTGTRNSFRNLKITQVDDDATSLTCFQEGGEGTYFQNCTFAIAVADNLDQTNAYDFVMGGDSCTFKECTFGLCTLLTSAARTVMAIDQVTASQEAKDNVFIDCLWMIASSSADANFIRILATTDAKFMNLFIRPVMFNALVTSNGAAALDDAVDSVSGLVEGNLLFVDPASNSTEFCTGVSDQVKVAGAVSSAQAGEAITPS